MEEKKKKMPWPGADREQAPNFPRNPQPKGAGRMFRFAISCLVKFNFLIPFSRQ